MSDDFQITREPMPVELHSWAEVADEVDDIQWLWPGWLPSGFVTMLAAESGTGKSALAMRIAMSVILGHAWPDGTPCAGGKRVLWCEAEAAQVINMSRAKQLGGAQLLAGLCALRADFFAETRLDDPGDLQRITEQAAHPENGLVVVDSLSGAHGKDENSTEAGRMVKGLSKIAQQTGKPILLTHHVRKPVTGESAQVTLQRIRGSSALTQFPRAVWGLSNVGGSALHLALLKSNMASALLPPVGMTICDAGVHFTDAPPVYEEPYESRSAIEEAKGFLLDRLGDGQRVPATEIYAQGEDEDISARTLRRAKGLLGIQNQREDGHSIWFIK